MARTQVDHYIPFFGRDFYASTAMWTAEEVGHYIRLLVIQWDSGGLPAQLERLELVSPGVGRVWQLLSSKFPLCDDGLRRNARMEEHRARAEDLKEARSEAGQEGNRKRWGDRKPIAKASQTDRKPIAKGIAKVSPPSPSPSPSPSGSPEEKCIAHTRVESDEFRQRGWAADEWQRFVSDWNVTDKATPWTPLVPPASWVDLAATPGWLERARQAMERLPSCQFFDQPVAVTRFFEYLDRILAGEFDNPKQDARKRREPVGGNL